MKIIVLSDYNHFVDVFSVLRNRYNVEVSYWFTSLDSIKERVNSLFPGVIIHDYYEAVRGIPPNDLSYITTEPLDEVVLRQYAYQECIVLKMMDSMGALNDFLYHERVRLYHTLLGYYLALIKKITPDLVFLGTSAPSKGFDYILFHVCQKNNIPTLYFEKTNIPGLIYPVVDDLDILGYPSAVNNYQKYLDNPDNLNIKGFSDNISKYLDSIAYKYDQGMPVHTRVRLAKLKKQNKTFNYQVLLGYIYNIIFKIPKRDYIKVKGKNIENYPNTYIELFKIKRFKRKETRRLEKHYNQLCGDIDLTKPYIFAALQNQPENSTSPKGSYFVHQILMIRLLSYCLPKGWKIYVKEHLTQFLPLRNPQKSKCATFYDDISREDNVVLVPLSFNSFELIDNSMATACISGSVGFESIMRGKPVLTFGNSWYYGCEGVFYSASVKKCQDSIHKILSGYTVNKDLVYKFMNIFSKIGVSGFCEPVYKEASGLSHEEVVSSFVNTIERLFLSDN